MPYIAEASKRLEKPGVLCKQRKHFKMPIEPDEPVHQYIIGVQHDSPFEYCTIGGVTFQKVVYPSEASFVSNQDKHYEGGVLSILLTENQVKMIKQYATELEIVIPAKANPKWKPGNGEVEYFPRYSVVAADWLILVKREDYNPYAEKFQTPKGRGFEGMEESKDALVEAQIKKKRK